MLLELSGDKPFSWNNDTSGIMSPAIRIGQPLNFLLYQMVLLQAVRFKDTLVILVELQRMYVVPCLLILI